MDFKVIFKDTFLEDLERIVRLIAARDPTAVRSEWIGASVRQKDLRKA